MSLRRLAGTTPPVALATLASFVLLMLGPTVGLATAIDSRAEPCVGCAGCNDGACAGESGEPFGSHHHCCSACCLSHVPLTLPTLLSSASPLSIEPASAPAPSRRSGPSPDTPYRPPRR